MRNKEYSEGHKASLMGYEISENPYTPNTKQFQDWADGYNVGIAENTAVELSEEY